MSDYGISAMNSTFGAQVVSKTLDNLNGTSSGSTPIDGQTFGAAVVSKTLDVMNSGVMANKYSGSSMANSFNFQKDVLSAVYSGKGTIADGDI